MFKSRRRNPWGYLCSSFNPFLIYIFFCLFGASLRTRTTIRNTRMSQRKGIDKTSPSVVELLSILLYQEFVCIKKREKLFNSLLLIIFSSNTSVNVVLNVFQSIALCLSSFPIDQLTQFELASSSHLQFNHLSHSSLVSSCSIVD